MPITVTTTLAQPTDTRTRGDAGSIAVRWTDNSASETDYEVQSRPIGGSFSTIATVGADTELYDDTAQDRTTPREYRVRATNSETESPYSNVATHNGTSTGTSYMVLAQSESEVYGAGTWIIDGYHVDAREGFEFDHQQLSIPTVLFTGEVDSFWDNVLAEEVANIPLTNGEFRNVYRPESVGDIELRIPASLRDVFDLTITGVIRSPDETQSAFDRHDFTLEFRRRSPKPESIDSPLSQTGDWEFDHNNGVLAVDGKRVRLPSRSDDGFRVELEVEFTDEQMHDWLRQFGTPDGVAAFSIPDGDDVSRDSTTTNRQTFTLSTPTGSVVADGDYRVGSWTATPLQTDYFSVQMTLFTV